MSNWFSRLFNKNDERSSEQLMSVFAQSGKPDLLDLLIQRNGDDLYHFLLSQSDSQLASDISQTTWLKVMEKREYYKTQGSFKSWLFTLGRNQLIDHFRQSNRWQYDEIVDDEHPSVEMDKQVATEQQLDLFNQILEQLPFLQKEAFMLQQEGFSLDEIAQITGDNTETVKSRIRYAKNRFKSLFNQTQEKAS